MHKLSVFCKAGGTIKFSQWIITRISHVYSAFNFFGNVVSICYSYSQIFEHFHIFIRYFLNYYILSLCYIFFGEMSLAYWRVSEQFFLRWGVGCPSTNPQFGGPPLVDCPRLLIQNIRSYPPYLEAVSPIRNLRTRHAVETGTNITQVSRAFARNHWSS